jgi:hypothetical protein
MSDFFAAVPTKAAKPHRCLCCESTIPKGWVYARCAGVWDGDFFSYPAHADCRAIYSDLRDELGADEMSAHLTQELSEYHYTEAQGTLDALRGRYPHVVCRIEFTLRDWLRDDDEDDDQ